jgi:cyanate permease
MMGLVKDATGSFTYGLLALAAMVVGGALIVLGFAHDSSLEHAPERQVA